MNKLLDKIFEQLTKIIGSTPVIILSITWCGRALAQGNTDFLDVVSMVTFIFGEFILRGQNVQDERQEKFIKQAVRDTKKDLDYSKKQIKMLNVIIKEVKDQRYQR